MSESKHREQQMMTFHPLGPGDAALLQDLPYASMPPEAMRQMLSASAAKTYNGAHFELLAVMDGATVPKTGLRYGSGFAGTGICQNTGVYKGCGAGAAGQYRQHCPAPEIGIFCCFRIHQQKGKPRGCF